MSRSIEDVRRQFEIWKSGDDEKGLELYLEQRAVLGSDFFDRRNPLMADRAQEYMAEGKKVFFVVGAFHLIRDGGVIDLLVQRGYHAERIGR